MVVIGGIIGSGIFINPYIVAQRLDTPGLVLGAWIAGGAIALAGALSYAELGALFPRAGGQYVYLRDAYHPIAGVLYGWALLAVIETGAIASVAIAFATDARRLVTLGLVLGAWIAGGAIALAGALSYAELGALFPRAGGQYVYLRDAYHPIAGFLYGWALLAVIETGAIAAVAIAFATYALRLVGGAETAAVPLAIAAIVILSIVRSEEHTSELQ